MTVAPLTVWFRPITRIGRRQTYDRLTALTLRAIPGEHDRLNGLLNEIVRVRWNSPDGIVVWARARLEMVDTAYSWDPEPEPVEIVKAWSAAA